MNFFFLFLTFLFYPFSSHVLVNDTKNESNIQRAKRKTTARVIISKTIERQTAQIVAFTNDLEIANEKKTVESLNPNGRERKN